MFEIVGLFAIGVIVGRWLRNVRFLRKVSGYVNVTVGLLIFVLGWTIGSNDNVIGELNRVLSNSVILSLCGITGSIVGAFLVGRLLGKER